MSVKKKGTIQPSHVPSAERTQEPVPDKPLVVQGTSIVVQSESVQEAVSPDAPQVEFVGIADLIKDIPESKVEMAEGLGIPIRGILTWATVIEANVKAQNKALNDLGVNLQPVVELAQKVKAQQAAAPAGSAPKDAGGLQMLMGLLQQSGLVGGQGISEGDRYFMEMGRESASLGNFVAKELFKKMMPEAIAKFDSERAAAK